MKQQFDHFPGLRYHTIERPYYGSFLYRIAFASYNTNRSFYSPMVTMSAIAADIQKYHGLHRRIRNRVADICGAEGFRYRKDRMLNIYCRDSDQALEIVEEFHDFVHSVYGPYDAVHRDRALVEPKILVKPRLWKGQFRYRATLDLAPIQRERFNDLMVDLVMGIDYTVNPGLERYMTMHVRPVTGNPFLDWYSADSKMLYLNDESLIMMIGLVCTDAIRKIDKVVTYDELSEQEKAAAQDDGAQPGQ